MIDATLANDVLGYVFRARRSFERTKREEKKRGESYVYEQANVKATNLFPYQCGDYVTNWKHRQRERVSPMCLTCDVKVAGTGACKAVLNICQASSAPRFEESRVVGVHLSIDRRVSNWKSTFFSIVRCRIAKKYLEKL